MTADEELLWLPLAGRIDLAVEDLLRDPARRCPECERERILDAVDDWSTSAVGRYRPGSAEEAAEMVDYEQLRDALLVRFGLPAEDEPTRRQGP